MSIFCIDPFALIISCFNSSFHNPKETRSSNKCLLTTINSPESTLLVYMFEV